MASIKNLTKALVYVSAAMTFFSCSPKTGLNEEIGAVKTGKYHNLFTEVCGIPEEEVQQRIDSLWKHFFTPGDFANFDGPEETSVYYEKGDDMGYIFDVGSNDVRTEGMSYGMMIALQLNHQDVFDRLWNWSKNYMQFKEGAWEGYFAWNGTADGTKLGNSNASDGEIYYVTCLYLAANRWNEPHYKAEADELLQKIQHKDKTSGVYPIFDEDTKLPCFVPNEDVHWFSDPSYCLPAFVDLWVERSAADNEFWAAAADSTRNLLFNSCHHVSGLYPDYCLMDGTPFSWSNSAYDTSRFMYDAIRCAMNVGMDAHWWGKDIERQRGMIRRQLTHFRNNSYTNGHYNHDGTNPTDGFDAGTSGANAVGCFALLGSDNPADIELMKETVQILWDQPIPSGHWRYYNGMVYMLSMLHVAGQFKAY